MGLGEGKNCLTRRRYGPVYLCPTVLARRQQISTAQRGDPSAQAGKGLSKAGWPLWWWGRKSRRKREGWRKDGGKDQRSPVVSLVLLSAYDQKHVFPAILVFLQRVLLSVMHKNCALQS